MVDALQNIALIIIIGVLLFDARNIKHTEKGKKSDKPDA
jgi:hypothetical protein